MEAETVETTPPSAITFVLQATWLLPWDVDSELTETPNPKRGRQGFHPEDVQHL